jgi:hypothetical protein
MATQDATAVLRVSTHQHPLSLGSRSMMLPSGRCADVLAISIRIVPSVFTNSWTSLDGICTYCICDRLWTLGAFCRETSHPNVSPHTRRREPCFDFFVAEPLSRPHRMENRSPSTLLALFTFSAQSPALAVLKALDTAELLQQLSGMWS